MPGQILVIDPVAVNRIVLRSRVTVSCYRVVQAGGPEEAFDRVAETRPDLILLGPGLEAGAACRLARDLAGAPASRGIPLLILTGAFDPAMLRAALLAGAEDALESGAQSAFLLARIRSLLRQRGIFDELAARNLAPGQPGLAEPAAAFLPRARIALVTARPGKGRAWAAALRPLLPHRLDLLDAQAALSRPPGSPEPDLFVIEDTPDQPDDSLRVLAELRSRRDSRGAPAILVGGARHRPGNAEARMAMALDIGAGAVMRHGFDPQELRLRAETLLARKRDDDRLRAHVELGLREALRDPLTGVHNRRYAVPQLERIAERAGRSGQPFALMMIDLDRFKAVNDGHGHAVGDAVLVETARRLADMIGKQDLLARFGGEEFLIAMPETRPDRVRFAAGRLRRAIAERPVAAGAVSLGITVSIGIAMADPADFRAPPGAGASEAADHGRAALQALLEQADRALYGAKAAGRNQVTFGSAA
ncbi:diguanylate cyclase [Mangrovicoccus algicola]|uniref:diguanylate cyclase n=1 Tax=Mangrovicoccus algicola TaxID=2771008 RepID=A0A8J7CH78_9RHOB|nr:diguanylate cyclase [Mangrovicoccus algicola]MBE3637935.1 diguanylate cyclase [Mangrovicoccus algicola]